MLSAASLAPATRTDAVWLLPMPALNEHSTAVLVIHEVVLQVCEPMIAVALGSNEPKLVPVMVTLLNEALRDPPNAVDMGGCAASAGHAVEHSQQCPHALSATQWS